MEIISVGSERNWKQNIMFVNPLVNFNCNFKCSYCYNSHDKEVYKQILSEYALNNLMDNLPKLNRDYYIFSLGGGEPSLYPYLDLFFEKYNLLFNNKNSSCYVSTNGSLLSSDLQNKKSILYFINKHKDSNIKIILTLHFEQLCFEEYIKILKDLPLKEKISIRMLLKPNELDFIKKNILLLTELGYSQIGIRGILDTEQKILIEYSKEELDFLLSEKNIVSIKINQNFLDDQNHIHSITTNINEYRINQELINYQGFLCLAGHNSLRIFPNGEISPCPELNPYDGFNLNNDNLLDYPYFKNVLTCSASKCLCPSYIALPKWKDVAYAPCYL